MSDISVRRQADAARKIPNSLHLAAGDADANGDVFLEPGDRLVLLTIASAFRVILPPVTQCADMIFVIRCVARTAGTVVLEDRQMPGEVGDSTLWTDITFNAAADRIVLYCDGLQWHTVTSTGV